MRMLDLFSGIGGFSLAAKWVWGDELEIVAFVEIDKFCQKVLKKHWPTVPIINDIREVTVERITANTTQSDYYEQARALNGSRTALKGWDTEIRIEPARCYDDRTNPRIDLLTGGFPCQPFSCAGKRKGRDDDRFLWPEMLRVIREVHPTWVIAENVGGIFTQEQGMVFGQVLSDLENEGYEVQPFCIPACAKNAPHRRDRWWIVACLPNVERLQEQVIGRMDNQFKQPDCHVADTKGVLLQGFNDRQKQEQYRGSSWRKNWLEVATSFCGMAHGVPNRVDRLKALGNSIVPQVAYEIMKGIRNVDNGYHNQSAR